MPRKKTSKVKEEKSIKEIQTELEEQAKQQRKLPEEIEKKLNRRVFNNIIIAIVIMVYLFFINIAIASKISIIPITIRKMLKMFDRFMLEFDELTVADGVVVVVLE